MRLLVLSIALASALAAPRARARDLDADPSTIAAVLPTLAPGDTLHLASGTYAGRIRITSLNGTEAMPIVIEGPSDGSARIEADAGPCCNMIELRDSSYVVLRHLTLDGLGVDGAFGISAGSGGAERNVVHHVTVEDCTFVGFGGSINHDAISTKTTTWGWILRRNVFDGAGIAGYFGNSDGSSPFIGGSIEHNLFVRCGGYCVQIKFQLPRPTDWPGMPTAPQTTIIRHNVFHHGDDASFEPRPSLLVGGFPATGLGSEDRYEIHGNLFVHHPSEALLQASGRVSIHDNVFADGSTSFPLLALRDHDLPLRQAWVYGNTFLTRGRAISVGAGDQGTALVGNAIFADVAMSGTFDDARDNVIDDLAGAGAALVSASPAIGALDPHPSGTALSGGAIDLSAFAADSADGIDLECRPRAPVWRGAYEGPAGARTWALALEIPPDLCGASPVLDAGVAGDGGTTADAATAADGSTTSDAGSPPPASGACACRAAGRAGVTASAWLGALALAITIARRRGTMGRP